MISFKRRRHQAASPELQNAPSMPPNRRCYAVGDVHGRFDLLCQTLEMIRNDLAQKPVDRAFLVFLGDLIDRGPASNEVIEHLRAMDWNWITPVFLLGNHEEALLASYDGDTETLRSWMGFGGSETAESYGISPVVLLKGDWHAILRALRTAIPAAHIAFLRDFYDQFALGDYLFVHAGVRPGVPLDRQDPRDLRWIRDEFLLSTAQFGKVVVHGHTISEGPQILDNRIGIDTGAFQTGRLTTLRLQDGERAILSTGHPPLHG